MEDWRPIQDFSNYSISDQGKVCNTNTGRIMSLSQNQNGLVVVGMMERSIQYKRSVSRLVANAFLPCPSEKFNSIINLDYDKFNNHVDNLAWRPLWFSQKYQYQIKMRVPGIGLPIVDLDTGEEFINPWDAVVKYGLLITEVIESINHQTRVWPTNQRFWRP